jgi:hypothetical protein
VRKYLIVLPFRLSIFVLTDQCLFPTGSKSCRFIHLLGRHSPFSYELLIDESLGISVGRETCFVLAFQRFTQERVVAPENKGVRREQVIVERVVSGVLIHSRTGVLR